MRTLLAAAVFGLSLSRGLLAAGPTIAVDSPMPPPAWALLERELLRANAAACREFFDTLLRRPRLAAVRRALGRRRRAGRRHRELHRLADPARPRRPRRRPARCTRRPGKGTCASTRWPRRREVPFARDGMYYKEFPVMFDWLHNGEGLTVFNLQGPVRPARRAFRPARAAVTPAST